MLCSSGAREESWFWAGNAQGGALTGAGYFSGALVNGISPKGSYGADINDDGAVTLAELTAYLLENHGASTPQVYPEEDDFVLFTYDVGVLFRQRRDAALEGSTFDSVVLSAEHPKLDFSFTMLRRYR